MIRPRPANSIRDRGGSLDQKSGSMAAISPFCPSSTDCLTYRGDHLWSPGDGGHETDKGANSIDVGILGPYIVVQIADALAQLVEHPCSFQGREGNRAVFDDSFSTGCNHSIYVKRPHYEALLGLPVARSYTARAGVGAQSCLPITKLGPSTAVLFNRNPAKER